MDLLREREKALSVVARRLGTSSSGLRRWVTQAEIDEGRSPVLASEEREELTCLRRATHHNRYSRSISHSGEKGGCSS